MFKFTILPQDDIDMHQQTLEYLSTDYAFLMKPLPVHIDYGIVINELILSVVNSQVYAIDGLCPHTTWIPSNFDVPKYSKGLLQVIGDVEPGLDYNLDSERWVIYVNNATGWVFIGDVKAEGSTVEFANNCVAIVGEGQLKAICLKPKQLPYINS